MLRARRGITGTLVGAAALALLLAACAQADGGGEAGGGQEPGTPSPSPSVSGRLPEVAHMMVVAGESGRGLPEGMEGGMDSPAGAAWAAEEGLLYVVTYGSSSCPTLAEADAVAEGDGVVVTLVPPPKDAICTMDWAPTTTVVAMPEGTDRGVPLKVRLGDLGSVEVPPRPAEAQAGAPAWVTQG